MKKLHRVSLSNVSNDLYEWQTEFDTNTFPTDNGVIINNFAVKKLCRVFYWNDDMPYTDMLFKISAHIKKSLTN